MGFEKEIRAVLPAVAEACGMCLAARETALEDREEKGDGTQVTTADYAAQFVLTKAIKKQFPKDEIVAEETPGFFSGGREDMPAKILKLLPGTGKSEFLETLARTDGNPNAGRFWAVDPIDGTAGFIEGAQFAVAVALLEDGIPALGFLGCPGLGFIMFAGGAGGLRRARVDGSGARRVGARKPRKKTVFCETARGSREVYAASDKIKAAFGADVETIRMDSQCKYALVAGGEADVFLRVPNAGGRKENIWDHAAGAAVARGGGAKVSDFDGGAPDFAGGKTLGNNRGIVAARRDIYDRVVDAIRKAGL